MKYAIWVLLLLSTSALAKKPMPVPTKNVDPMEGLNRIASSVDRDLTELHQRIEACTENQAETKAQLEGLVFAVRSIRESMQCQYEESACRDESKNFPRAEAAMKDLVVKMNGSVYEMLVLQYGRRSHCAQYVNTLSAVKSKILQYKGAFDFAKSKRPAVPAR